MKAFEVPMFRPEVYQNIVQGLVLVSMPSTKDRVNDFWSLFSSFLAFNLVGQAMVGTAKNILCSICSSFALQITFITLSTWAQGYGMKVTLPTFPCVLIPGMLGQFSHAFCKSIRVSSSINQGAKIFVMCHTLLCAVFYSGIRQCPRWGTSHEGTSLHCL